MAVVSYEKYFKIPEMIRQIAAYLPNFDAEKFKKAFEFAEQAHQGQFRKDGKTPYIAHPVEVAKILTSLHADEDTLVSALLHDVPEDTERTIEEVKAAFGEKVAFLVDGITKLSKVYYQNDMPQRQIESLKKLFLHSSEDLRVILIKLADRLHNMRTLGNIQEVNKRLRIAGETLEIYVPIANLLGIQVLKSQLEDLCFKNILPIEYEKLDENFKKNESRRSKLSQDFIKIVQGCCTDHNIKTRISRKLKSLYSIYKKISSMGKTVDQVDDRVAIKLVVENVPDCYHVLGLIHSKFVPINDRFRDYIANPKNNGYQSLHTTVFGSEGVMTEIQIKTGKMDAELEYRCITDEKHSGWVNKILEIEKNQKTSEDFLDNIKADIFEDRIFVFSPKGLPIDLPKGATALDFAYAIHTDVGNYALKADIDGEIKPISVALKTGDVVKIVLSKKATPELSWLSLVKTNSARNKILEYFKKINRSKKINVGLKILQKQFDILGLGLVENVNFKKISGRIKEETGKIYQSRDDIYAAVAEGEIQTDDVIGHVDGSGLKNLNGKPIRIDLRIVAKNRFGLLREISEILYNNVLDMYSLKGWASKYETDAFFSAEILITNLDVLSHIFDEIEQVEGVTGIYRLSTKGITLFTITSSMAALLWIAHGFIIRTLSQSSLMLGHPWITDFLIYLGLFLMIVAVLLVRNLAQKYFPFMRNRRLLWMISFILPVVASTVLFFEMIYFDLKLNWITTLIEVVFVYAYLLMNYIHFRKTMKQI